MPHPQDMKGFILHDFVQPDLILCLTVNWLSPVMLFASAPLFVGKTDIFLSRFWLSFQIISLSDPNSPVHVVLLS